MTDDIPQKSEPICDSGSNDPLIESQVRRILQEGELEVRRGFVEEFKAHRDFIDRQVGMFLKFVAVLLVVGGGLFSYFFGRSVDALSSQLEREVESQVIKYAIVEEFQQELEDMAGSIVNSDTIRADIESAVREELRADIDRIVAEAVKEELADLSDQKIEGILIRAYGTQLDEIEAEIDRTSSYTAILHRVLDKNLDDEYSQKLLDRVRLKLNPIRPGN